MSFLEKVTLNVQQLVSINTIIPGAAVDTQEAFRFRKINYSSQIFYSKSCSKVTKRNSYTVVFVDGDGNLKVGMIINFLKVLLLRNACPYHLAAMQQLQPYPDEDIMAGIDVSSLNKKLGNHLKPFHLPRFVEFVTCVYRTSSNQRLGVRSLPVITVVCCWNHYCERLKFYRHITYWQSPLLFCGFWYHLWWHVAWRLQFR